VIVDDFDRISLAVMPCETDPPLLIDPNAVLALSIPLQSFQSVSWRDSQVFQRVRTINEKELSQCQMMEIRGKSLRPLPGEDGFGNVPLEAPNHVLIITSRVNNVKRYACLTIVVQRTKPALARVAVR